MEFWNAIWKEDLRATVRDLISQMFFVVVTVLLDSVDHALLEPSGVEAWLKSLIYAVFDGLTVVALGTLAIPMAVRMVRSGAKAAVRK